MFSQDFIAEFVTFALPQALHPSAFEPQVKTANSGEQ